MDTHIAVIIDASGSMSPQRADTLGGFAAWLEEAAKGQQQGDKVTVSVTTFDTSARLQVKAVPIRECPPLGTDANPYYPGGGTALLDAVGITLTDAKKRVTKGKRGIAVIITDGEENSSHAWTTDKVGALISELEAKGNWSFMYLGSDFDAWSNARTFAPSTLRGQTFAYVGAQTVSAYSGAGSAIQQFMSTNSVRTETLGSDARNSMEEFEAEQTKKRPTR